MNQQPTKPLCKLGLHIFPEEGWMDGGTHRWSDIKAMAQAAEDVNFDSILIPDRMTQIRDGEKRGIWESTTLLAAIAAVTSRIEIGHAVLRSVYRNPALTARMAETIDEISGGRFILGIGPGSSAAPPRADNHSFGYPTDYPVSRFEEALRIVLGLLRDGYVDFRGRFYSANQCTLQPRGPRPSGPRLLLPAMGPRMMRLAARHADIWGAPVVATEPEGYESLRRSLESACAEVGRNPNSIEKMVIVAVDPVSGKDSVRTPYGPALTGSPERIASAMLRFSAAGYDHILLVPFPNTPAAVLACAPVLRAFRQELQCLD